MWWRRRTGRPGGTRGELTWHTTWWPIPGGTALSLVAGVGGTPPAAGDMIWSLADRRGRRCDASLPPVATGGAPRSEPVGHQAG